MTTTRSRELLHEPEASRDAAFQKILAVLNPLVITKPEVVRKMGEAPASEAAK